MRRDPDDFGSRNFSILVRILNNIRTKLIINTIVAQCSEFRWVGHVVGHGKVSLHRSKRPKMYGRFTLRWRINVFCNGLVDRW